MTWFKVDDNLAMHPKVLRAGNDAIGMWVRSGSWSAQQLTDGHIPTEIVAIFGGEALAEKLVSAGLWARVDDGFLFHEWEKYQPSRQKVEREREAAQTRKERWKERRKEQAGNAVPDDVPNGDGNAVGTMPRPDPTRPDPKDEETKSPRRRKAKKAETPCPDIFPVTDAMRKYVADRRIPSDVARTETDRFLDYHRAKGSTFVDWQAAWRTWMGKVALDCERRNPTTTRDEVDVRGVGGISLDVSML